MGKFIRFVIIFISILHNLILLSACGNTADKQKPEEENVEIMDNLHLDSEEFAIENYFIRNECQYSNHYYIDSDNVLWGYGDNTYGQLGNGQQYSRDADGEYRSERTPQKIAEHVIHVDFGGYFVIFLTENGELYGIGANLNGVMGMELSVLQQLKKTGHCGLGGIIHLAAVDMTAMIKILLKSLSWS